MIIQNRLQKFEQVLQIPYLKLFQLQLVKASVSSNALDNKDII